MNENSETGVGKGRCLCGKVGVTANHMSHALGVCHCSMCRRWSGGPVMAVDCGSEVCFEGEENIKLFASSAWAERGFCRNCGSHLFYRLKHNNQYMMSAGLFGDEAALVFERQLFIDEKPAYYCFANDTLNLTGPEIFARFAPT